ncbi:hypothetical protein [Hydrogenobacter hydrogenophilus]|uniref:hypothetical protein n=1 Tax=Hydrogenobacter hydrogenophilus TaxID=35835 RepID=UPI0026C1A93D
MHLPQNILKSAYLNLNDGNQRTAFEKKKKEIRLSDTAKYGDLTRGERIYKLIKPLMKEILSEIQNAEGTL